MARITLELDPDTYQKLVERAVDQRRPIVWQAEIELRRALEPRPRRERGERPSAIAEPR